MRHMRLLSPLNQSVSRYPTKKLKPVLTLYYTATILKTYHENQ